MSLIIEPIMIACGLRLKQYNGYWRKYLRYCDDHHMHKESRSLNQSHQIFVTRCLEIDIIGLE
jgi:hypothetical protein